MTREEREIREHFPLICGNSEAYLDNAADGIAVGIDSGEFNEIHPKDKRNVSDRLARQALYKVYSVLPEREAFGPVFSKAESVEAGADSNSENAVGSLVLTFDHAEEGFIVRAVNPSEDERAHETDIINNDGIIGFEIAGKDGVYYPAVVSFTYPFNILSPFTYSPSGRKP